MFFLQALEGYSRFLGFDPNTVPDSLSENAKFLDRIWDLTATREAGFAKILARDVMFGKKTVFGIEMSEVRNAGLP